MTSYYGRPVIKEPVWTWEIPAYLFTGGVGGASAVLSLAARIAGNEPLAKTSLYVGAAADLASPPLLISDLGRPERFLNMLRVFKVTSPMSVGSWILFVSGGASTTAAVLEKAGRLKRIKLAAEVVSALAGGPLATYTGGLFADTAVPVWHEARRELPYLFGASAAASAGAASTLFLEPEDAGPARRLAVGAAVAELGVARRMEQQLGSFLAEPYRQGLAGALTRASKTLVGAGAGMLALRGKRSRRAAVAGSGLLLAGEVVLRFAVWQAGKQSARDPKYTVEPQRARVAARQEEAKAGEGSAPQDAVRSGALVGPGTRT
jgi:formate-dependent nitrite reductase membrane component NrfD